MAGAGTELVLISLVVLLPILDNVGHLVQIVRRVEPQRVIAVHVPVNQGAGLGINDHILTGTAFVVRLFGIIQARGNRQRGFQMPVHKKVQPLGQLIDDNAVILIHLDGFQPVRFDIAGYKGIEVFDFAVMKARGISLDQRPAVVQRLQHMQTLAAAGDHADGFAVFIRLFVADRLLHHVQIDHGHRGCEHLPDGFLVRQVHRRAPVAVLMLRPVFTAVSRSDIRFFRLCAQQKILRRSSGKQHENQT